jgi:hypothetical protein
MGKLTVYMQKRPSRHHFNETVTALRHRFPLACSRHSSQTLTFIIWQQRRNVGQSKWI